jgi:hypothetical protein
MVHLMRRETVMFSLEVAQRPSDSTFARRESMNFTWRLCPSCSVAANDYSTILDSVRATTALSNTCVHQLLPTCDLNESVMVWPMGRNREGIVTEVDFGPEGT